VAASLWALDPPQNPISGILISLFLTAPALDRVIADARPLSLGLISILQKGPTM
jgi:hypothetical protein